MQPQDLKAAIQAGDGSAVRALVDAFFSGLEAKNTNPLFVAMLKVANGAVDGALASIGL